MDEERNASPPILPYHIRSSSSTSYYVNRTKSLLEFSPNHITADLPNEPSKIFSRIQNTTREKHDCCASILHVILQHFSWRDESVNDQSAPNQYLSHPGSCLFYCIHNTIQVQGDQVTRGFSAKSDEHLGEYRARLRESKGYIAWSLPLVPVKVVHPT